MGGALKARTLAVGAALLFALMALAGQRAAAQIPIIDDLLPLPGAPGEQRPSVILISTDDQTLASLKVMERTRNVLVNRGVSFDNHIATFPLCCPARATWITGQYAHNHGVIDNQSRNGGGYPALREPGRVLPVWLDAAGYDTAVIGKFLHEYSSLRPPPGWDRYSGIVPPNVTRYYDYAITNGRGGLDRYGSAEGDYQTDVLTRRYAIPYIQSRQRDSDPFFLHVSYTGPHWGKGRNDAAGRRCANRKPFSIKTARAKPAPRHASSFRHRRLPRPASFNEPDVSDKPAVIAGRRRLRNRQIRDLTERYRCELASLLSIDDGVAEIYAALERSGRADDTFVVFTSDNGYMHGEHRIPAEKVQPYEEAIRVPFVVRGPGVPRGVTISDPVANVDLAPTILELTGVGQPASAARTQDGRSLAPQLLGSARADRAVLIEAKRPPRQTRRNGVIATSFSGVRTRRYVYVEHHRAVVGSVQEGFGLPIGAGAVTERELYDLATDPFQVVSQHAAPAYAAPRTSLAALLARLRGCAGAGCVVDAAVPPPARAP